MLQKIFDPSHEIGQALIKVRPALYKAAAFSFVLNLLYLAPSLYMLQVYDRVLSSYNLTTLAMLTAILLVVYLLFWVMDRARGQMLIRVGVQLDRSLSERVFTASFDQSLRRAGPGPSQALNDLTIVRQFLSTNGAIAFFDTPWVPVYLLVVAVFSPWLGLFALCTLIVLFLIALVNEWRTHAPLTLANKEAAAAHQFVVNNLRHAETVRAMGMLSVLRQRWQERHDKILTLQTLASDDASGLGSLSKVARLLFQSLILALGALLAVNGQITPGTMIAASILMGRALAPVEMLIGVWKHWISAKEAHARLVELTSSVPAPAPSLKLPAPRGVVLIEEASAIPPGGQKNVLQDLSIRMEAGDVVAVAGPSGSGKSTLARLLVGVWPPSTGSVRLDGADVHGWDKEQLGPHVGYLPQEIALFEGTVAENIGRFSKLVDSEAVVKAAKAAGVHDLVLRLPQGYDTPVGPDGVGLSGGQRQRIALARALYGEPSLLVLDEPNSNLDQAGEAALVAAVRAAKSRGCTVVLITHSAAVMPAAEKMLVLREGQLVAYGPREKVLAHLKEQAQRMAAGAAQQKTPEAALPSPEMAEMKA